MLKKAELGASDLLQECEQTFTHAQTIAKRYLGVTHFFTQKIQRKIDRVHELCSKQEELQPLTMKIQSLKEQVLKKKSGNIMQQHE